jgi:ubiquinone/menaquinone biosynthesis C-methylase UbiE
MSQFSRYSRAVSLYDQTWGRMMAATYDRFLKGTEDAGLSEWRTELVEQASDRTLEVGAGTGLNLAHYPEAVTELTLTEPFGPMVKRLRARLERSGRKAVVVQAPAYELPFGDSSFDTVVGTLVLCTVAEQEPVLAELRRVLRPGGRLLFIEHVRSGDPKLARWQDRLHRPWRWFGHGCNCNRDTRAAIEAAGFEITEISERALPKAPPIVRPAISGTAVSPAGVS